MRALPFALCFAMLWAATAFAQVRVEARPSKDVYLQREPIFIDVVVENTGEYPVAYGSGGITAQVDSRSAYAWRNTCDDSFLRGVSMSGGASSHPPMLLPGRRISQRVLLRGYRLEPGRHDIRTFGKAPVWWRQPQVVPTMPPQPPSIEIPFKPSDAVPGATVDLIVSVTIKPATEDELRQALLPLINSARQLGFDNHLDRLAIFETAAPMLLDDIVYLAEYEEFGGEPAYEALADINTPESRAHLRRLFDETDSVRHRGYIVNALRRTKHADNVDFFVSLLPGRYAADEEMKRNALAALQCVGADIGSKMVDGTRDWPPAERIAALGNSGVPEAVTAIVNHPIGEDVDLLFQSCSALITLTHHACSMEGWDALLDDPRDPKAVRELIQREQAVWRRWWSRNQKSLPIFGPHQPPPERELPVIR